MHLRRMLLLLASLTAIVEAQTVTRGPYLQTGAPTGVIVKWSTDLASDSVLRYGSQPAALTFSRSDPTSTTRHRIDLSGLLPNTKYFYSVGTSARPLAGGDDTHFFVTSPEPGTAKATRVWVIGDSGTANSNAQAVRDAFLTFTGTRYPDLWIMLGDNAYEDGTDRQYQRAVFDMYPRLLRNTVLWPTLGNHDGHRADSASQSGPYYDIFSLPRNAEAGGVPSGTEAYYSFDYGNIHFICLESHQTNRSPSGAMMTWLQADLQANDKQWVVAFWHHPPYSKGSHDSDAESALIEMRENALPILEQYGVDLVLSGHSHSYERSYLIDGHYGRSNSLNAAMKKDGGDGHEAGDGAYRKPAVIAAPHQGAVYAVAGSSGKTSGGPLNHPAMVISLNSLGSMVLDIHGGRLDGRFLDDAGNVRDEFTILRGSETNSPQISSVEAGKRPTEVTVTFSERLEPSSARAPSNYAINPSTVVSGATLGADGRTVTLTVTPPLDLGIVYTLTVNNLLGLSGKPIAPNSKAQFAFSGTINRAFQDGVAPFPSYAGTADTYLSENASASNFGVAPELLVDGDDPSGSEFDLLALMRWDLSEIPPGSVVSSAKIAIDVTNKSDGIYDIYAVKRPWAETEATWGNASNGMPWEVAGAGGPSDRGQTVLGSIAAPATGPLSVLVNSEGVALVQSWINNPSSNYGVIVANPSANDGLDFVSSDHSNAVRRPRLEITLSSGPLQEADLALSIVDGVDPIISGSALTYTVTVRNRGPADAGAVVVRGSLAGGVTFLSSSGCAEGPQALDTCTLRSIAANSSKSYTVKVAVEPGISGSITKSASVTSEIKDPELGNNMAQETTSVRPPWGEGLAPHRSRRGSPN